jgi:hypothetical protein
LYVFFSFLEKKVTFCSSLRKKGIVTPRSKKR